MSIRSRAVRTTVLGAAVALAVPLASPAAAGGFHSTGWGHHGDPRGPLVVTKTLADDFVGPLQFEVSRKGVYVTDAFTSLLRRIGTAAPIAVGPGDGGDVSGVAVDDRTGAIAYASSNADHSATTLTVLRKGRAPLVADLSGHESSRNPDGRTTYGIKNPTPCQEEAFAELGGASYTGIVDSHPYAVASLGHGAWAVADAGGNDVLKVDARGRVSTIAVLPKQALTLTAAFAESNGLPDCVVGASYAFEAVPTDVEVGPFGTLVVSTLPGGPEDPSAGPRGSVYAIDWKGRAHRLATGFNGPTNVAVGRSTVYVAELFAGRITALSLKGRTTVAELPGVAAVEYDHGSLYASTAPAVTGSGDPGTVVRLGKPRS